MDRGALLQSSGADDCMNMLLSNQECRMLLLALVTMRGEWGNFMLLSGKAVGHSFFRISGDGETPLVGDHTTKARFIHVESK